MRSVLILMLVLAVPATASAAPVMNIAHRGASGHAPEHTFAAYDLALEMGATYIEQDLQMTSDGVLVVVHDDTLDRTARGPAADCTGPVRTKTLEQLRRCEVGSWFDARFTGEPIPTLAEVFERYGRRVNYYIETKSPESAPGMEEALVALLDEHGLRRRAARRWQVLLQSFSPASLLRLHAIAPELPLIQLGTVGDVALLDAIAAYAVGIGPSAATVDAALVQAAHERCLAVHPYTVDERSELEALVALGVDGAFTNLPDRFRDVLGKRRGTPAQAAAARRRCLERR